MFQVEHHLLAWLFWLPALTFALSMLAKLWPDRRLAVAINLAGALATAALVVWLADDLLRIVPDKRRFVTSLGAWISGSPLHIHAYFLFDTLTSVVALAVLAVASAAAWVRLRRWREHSADSEPAYALLILGAMMALTARDFLWFYAGWVLSGAVAYRLMLAPTDEPRRSWRTVWLMSLFADLWIVLAALVLRKIGGTLDIVTINFELLSKATHIPSDIKHWTALLLTVAIVVRAGLLPFGLWWIRGSTAGRMLAALPVFVVLALPGVYLICRFSVLFSAAPIVLSYLATIGVWSAVVFAVLALFETSLARGLVALFLAQLSLTFAGLGSGAFLAGLSHVVTLAAAGLLLFVAGHEVFLALKRTGDDEDPDDLTAMGGLGRRLPSTFIWFGLGTAALVGLVPFSSFWSLHAILWSAHATPLGAKGAGWLLFAALLTVFAAIRLLLNVFYGPYRGRPEAQAALATAAPWPGRASLVLAAAVALSAGWWLSPSARVFLGAQHASEWLRLAFRNSTLVLKSQANVWGMTMGEGGFVFFLAMLTLVVAVAAWFSYMLLPSLSTSGTTDRRGFAPLQRGTFVVAALEFLVVKLPFALAAVVVAAGDAISRKLSAILGWLPARLLLGKNSAQSSGSDPS